MENLNETIMDKLVIYGTGRHAELTAYYIHYHQLYETVAFTVNKEFIKEKEFNGLPVVPYEELEEYYPPESFRIFIAIGPQYVNKSRKQLYLDAKGRGYKFGNVICGDVEIRPGIEIGENVYIESHSGIAPFVKIGNNVTIIASKIGHHCVIEDHAFISASILAGNVRVKEAVFIGLNSSIGPNITLGESTVIGLGCVIRKDTEPKSVYVNSGTQKLRIDSSKVSLL